MLSGCDVVACLFLVFLAVCKLNCNSLLLIKYFLNLETDILAEDIELIASQANVSLEEAENALKETNGDLAEAILKLSG